MLIVDLLRPCISLQSFGYHLSLHTRPEHALNLFANVLTYCTSPHLENLVVLVVGSAQAKYLSRPRAAWDALQRACQQQLSLKTVIIQQSPSEPKGHTDTREAVIREMLPELVQSGLLHFCVAAWRGRGD